MTTRVTSSLITSVANTQITGLITNSQIDFVSNTKISGLITDAQLASSQALEVTGVIKMWPTATAPTGYLVCNGQAVSRTTFAALFSVLGTTFGVGNGSTTFNVPNYVDRMPIGSGNLYTTNSQGGSRDAIVVSHTHTATVTDPGHTHSIFARSLGASPTTPNWIMADVNSGGGQNIPTTSSATTGVSVSVSSTGSSGTNANLPPYIGINFIIKT